MENNITNNRYDGIFLYDSFNNSIYGNNIAHHTTIVRNGSGISLWASSDNNTLSGNNITNNYLGIQFLFSSNNTLSENNITNNHEGIRLGYSHNNKFYHNNFIDNTQQANITTSGHANFWNDGYPFGNYWSDYTDVDQYSGPYQNETGSDGIWDHPYVLNELNKDNYPLVPEFPTWTSILLILIVFTFTVVIYKRRLLKTPIH